MRGGERKSRRRRLAKLSRIIGLLAAAFLALGAGPAVALYVHPEANEALPFGKGGTNTTDFPPLVNIAFGQASDHLYVFANDPFGGSENGVYGFDASALGTHTPLGGNFPLKLGSASSSGADLATDNSGQPTAGNLYFLDDGVLRGFDSSGTALGGIFPFSPGFQPSTVAVDPDGHIWLSEGTGLRADTLKEYSATTGVLLKTIELPFLQTGNADAENGYPGNFAFDSDSNIYLLDAVAHTGFKLTAASGYTSHTPFGPAGALDVAVDRLTDAIYIVRKDEVTAWDPAGNLRERFATGSSQLISVAVDDSNHAVYLNDKQTNQVRVFPAALAPTPTTGAVSDVTASTASVEGHVDLAGGPDVQSCRFEYATAAAHAVAGFVPAVTGSVPCAQATPYSSATDVSADLSGLQPGTAYRFRLVAGNADASGGSAPGAFQTPGPPLVQSLSVSDVTADSARVGVRIDPQGADTSYRVEYGTTGNFGSAAPVPEGTVAAGFGLQNISVELSGLQSTAYFFRVVATNAEGTTVSETSTFGFYPTDCPNASVRQQTGAAYVPDCRAYELVSPEYAAGTILYSGGPQDPYAHDRYAFTGNFGTIPGAGEPINTTGDLYVATRGSTGWSTKYVGPPPTYTGCAGGPPVQAGAGWATTVQNLVVADPGLHRFVQWPLGSSISCVWTTIGIGLRAKTDQTSSNSSNAPFLRDENGAIERWPTAVAEVPGAQAEFNCGQNPDQVEAAGADCTTHIGVSKDLSHFVFSTQADLFGMAGAQTAAPGSAYDNDTENNTLSLISLDANGDPIAQESPANGGPTERIQFPHVSTDGSHILMGTKVNEECRQTEYPDRQHEICPMVSNPTHLYMRVNDAVTYDIAGQPVTYIDSTPDGTKVYFTSPDPLTAEDTDSSVDLYMWEENGGSPSLVLVSQGSGGGNADDCGAGWIANCDAATYNDASITNASGNQGGLSPTWNWETADFLESAPRGLTDNAVASESGDIYFYSPEVLDAGKGIPGATNLYLYRNGAVRHVATLDRTPYCIEERGLQTDMRPTACSDGPVARLQVTPDGHYAAFVTASQITSYDNAGHGEMYRYDAVADRLVCVSCRTDGTPPNYDVLGSQAGRFVTDDGRVFFDTAEPLVPTDTNLGLDRFGGELGHDVYEFVGGRPQLITPGTGTGGGGTNFVAESRPGLYGVSADGTDVYFATVEPLVANDRNGNQLRIYDARTNGGFPQRQPLLPCQAADECHGPTSAAPGAIGNGTGAALGAGGNHRAAKQKKKHHRRKRGRSHAHKAKGDKGKRAGRHGRVRRGAKRSHL